jgi:YHS domain-containing protein
MYRLLIIFGLLVLLYFLARHAIREFRGGYRRGEGLVRKDEMVQDPICRTYVPRATALEEKIGGQMYYFCSKECAETFQKQLSA